SGSDRGVSRRLRRRQIRRRKFRQWPGGLGGEGEGEGEGGGRAEAGQQAAPPLGAASRLTVPRMPQVLQRVSARER
ncbi:Protein of unknown function, partial [Gryllus bimaculatus]